MKDFLDAHTHTKGSKPKLSRSRSSIPAVKPFTPPAPPAARKPEWLSDFGSSPAPKAPAAPAAPRTPRTSREPAAAEPDPKKKPDWMKDFD